MKSTAGMLKYEVLGILRSCEKVLFLEMHYPTKPPKPEVEAVGVKWRRAPAKKAAKKK